MRPVLGDLQNRGRTPNVIILEGSNGGPVGAAAGSSGPYTGSYEPPGWDNGAQQDWTPGAGDEPSSDGPAPGPEIGNSCDGSGVPCYLRQRLLEGQQVGFFTRRGQPGYGVQTSYIYVVEDVNGNPTAVDSVAELLTPLVEWNSKQNSPQTWETIDGTLVNGISFTDNIKQLGVIHQQRESFPRSTRIYCFPWRGHISIEQSEHPICLLHSWRSYREHRDSSGTPTKTIVKGCDERSPR